MNKGAIAFGSILGLVGIGIVAVMLVAIIGGNGFWGTPLVAGELRGLIVFGLAYAMTGTAMVFEGIGTGLGWDMALGNPTEVISPGTYRVLYANKTVAKNHVLLLVRDARSEVSSPIKFVQLPAAVFPENLQFGELLYVREAILDGKAQKTFWFGFDGNPNQSQSAQSGGWS